MVYVILTGGEGGGGVVLVPQVNAETGSNSQSIL